MRDAYTIVHSTRGKGRQTSSLVVISVSVVGLASRMTPQTPWSISRVSLQLALSLRVVGSTTHVNLEVTVNFSGGGFSNYFERPRYQDAAVFAYLDTIGNTNPGLSVLAAGTSISLLRQRTSKSLSTE